VFSGSLSVRRGTVQIAECVWQRGRNTLKGPAYQQWDFSAIKTIPIHEAMNVQFRAEFFNIFNNVNFRLPDNDINSPTFGYITAAQPGV
jgi:hypothetical protein